MLHATISEARNQLSSLLERVKAGEEVLIYERDRPCARIVRAEVNESEQLRQLVSSGKIAPASSPKKFRPQPVTIQADILQALLDERETGR